MARQGEVREDVSVRRNRSVMAAVTNIKEICRANGCLPSDAVMLLLTAAAYICHEHTNDPKKSLNALRDALPSAVFTAQEILSDS